MPEDRASARRDMAVLRLACMQRARAALRTFGLDDADIEDLVQDFLAVHLAELARADLDSPETFFCVAVRNAARDKIRTARRRRGLLEQHPSAQVSPSPPPDVLALDRLNEALQRAPPRQQAIFLAAVHGDDREAIARAFHTSRANVDQIVRRVRILLAGAWAEGDAG